MLDPATGQLMEQFLIELLVGVLAPHGKEDVSANKLMDDLAVS